MGSNESARRGTLHKNLCKKILYLRRAVGRSVALRFNLVRPDFKTTTPENGPETGPGRHGDRWVTSSVDEFTSLRVEPPLAKRRSQFAPVRGGAPRPPSGKLLRVPGWFWCDGHEITASWYVTAFEECLMVTTDYVYLTSLSTDKNLNYYLLP